MKNNMKRDIDFLYEMGCFRFVERTWKQYFRGDLENNTEHTFRVIWIALMLARRENVSDHEKILKMALVHDIGESRTGDVHYISRLYTTRDESGALKDIFADTVFSEELTALWEEYERCEGIEAKIVKDADILDVDLEIVEQASREKELTNIFKEKRKERVYPKLYTKSAKKLFDEIYSTSPHHWHLTAKNRFSSGDLKKGN